MKKEPQPKYVLSKATAADAVDIRTLQAKSWLDTYPNEAFAVSFDFIKERTDQWLLPDNLEESKKLIGRNVIDPTQFYRIAKLDTDIVGFVHVSTKESGAKYIEAIYTDPETLGTGLGGMLMASAEEWIGDDDVTLEVASYNDRAIQFYEKRGYEKVEGSETIFTEIIPIFTMKRKGANHEV